CPLVLVIILLVTAPLLSVSTLPVNLPAAHTREAEDRRNVCVTRSAIGGLAVDNMRVRPEALASVLRGRLAEPGNGNVLVVIRADAGTPYGEVRQLLQTAHDAGAKRVAVATRQETETTE